MKGIRGYGVQVPRTSTPALLQSVEEQDEGRGLSGEFPSPGKSGNLSHQSRGLEGGLQKHMYASFVYLIFFLLTPTPISQKLGHLQSPASIHPVLHLGGLLPISEL